MLTVYGMMICPDCVKCREELDGAGIVYEFRDFADSTKNLKGFLALRDTNPVFEGPRQEGAIRFRFCPFDTMEEVDAASDMIAQQVTFLRKYRRR